jgi:SAM-dependent methyltransferase
VVHEVAAAGFSDAADYEAARPSYPPAVVAWFVDTMELLPTKRLCDLAAGTGKFTRLLVDHADVVALEPIAGMREQFRAVLPNTPLASGTAEALPLRDESLDAITVAQAWHWFDSDRAFAEVHRVLRPNGWVGAVWNARDRSVPWVNDVWSIMDRLERSAPWRSHDAERDAQFQDVPGFRPVVRGEFRHDQAITREGVVKRVASVSHVAVLDPVAKETVLDEVREVLARLRSDGDLKLPYRVDCYALQRV